MEQIYGEKVMSAIPSSLSTNLCYWYSDPESSSWVSLLPVLGLGLPLLLPEISCGSFCHPPGSSCMPTRSWSGGGERQVSDRLGCWSDLDFDVVAEAIQTIHQLALR